MEYYSGSKGKKFQHMLQHARNLRTLKLNKWKWKSLHWVWLFATTWTVYSPWNSPGQNTGEGSHCLFQGSSQPRDQTQVSCDCRRILYHLSHKGSPRILEWVDFAFSRGSSQPRNQTAVSWIAGKFFTNWAIRVTLNKPVTRRQKLFNSTYVRYLE